MIEKGRLKHIPLIAALLIIFITIGLIISVYFRIIQLHILYEQYYYHHWFSWIGTVYIAIAVPVYYILKRRYSSHFKLLYNIHIFGNLFAFMLVSIHFTQQISRPPQAYPSLGTGIVLYAALIGLIGTGFLLRFFQTNNLSIKKSFRYIHTSVTLTFYFIIFVHILHGINII